MGFKTAETFFSNCPANHGHQNSNDVSRNTALVRLNLVIDGRRGARGTRGDLDVRWREDQLVTVRSQEPGTRPYTLAEP